MLIDGRALRSTAARIALVVAGLLVALAALAGPSNAAELGRSVEGREIPLATLGPADAPARVLVVGSIHGDEPGGLAVTRRLRRRPPPSGVELWVIDTLNPDGLARGTRQNARGVDLNRNFPLRWRRQGRPGPPSTRARGHSRSRSRGSRRG